ncbi:MAG: phytanoyl-CoA dioxygenase family protein [Burkholderiaceae bacterium]
MNIEQFRELGYAHVTGAFSARLLANIERGLCATCENSDPSRHSVQQPAGRALLELQELFADARLVEFARRALKAKVKLSLIEFAQTPTERFVHQDGDSLRLGWSNATGVGIHRDGAWLEQDMDVAAPPMLTLKAAIWFSDVGLGDGNLRLWPGSHALRCLNTSAFCPPDHAHLDICAKAGDVTWFDRRTFHSRTLNASSSIRKVAFVEYSVTWLKRKQDLRIDAATRGGLSDRAKELVLDPVDHWSLYWP